MFTKNIPKLKLEKMPTTSIRYIAKSKEENTRSNSKKIKNKLGKYWHIPNQQQKSSKPENQVKHFHCQVWQSTHDENRKLLLWEIHANSRPAVCVFSVKKYTYVLLLGCYRVNCLYHHCSEMLTCAIEWLLNVHVWCK